MADILESRLLHFYGGRPTNYLYDWARRTGHVDDIDQFTVEVTTDAAGVPVGNVIRKQDEPVAESPSQSYNRNADTPAKAEKPGRGKAKAADKSVFD